jgi:putative transposase
LTPVKAVAFEYERNEAVRPLLESFLMMVNHALWVGIHEGIRGHFNLNRTVYHEFKRYGLHTHYTLSACEVASAMLKNHRRDHRSPIAKKLFLKLDNQTYQLREEILRIPTKPRCFLALKLKLGDYQHRFLEDSSLRLASMTLTERKVIVAFERRRSPALEHVSVAAYDTNELSLDGAFSNAEETKPVHVNLREIARIRAFHFQRRRHLQSRQAQCQRKLRLKLCRDRDRERRRVDVILHRVAKKEVNFAKEKNAKIVLEDLKGVRRSVNRHVRKRNPYNDKPQLISVHSKALKRRLNAWPFRRLHAFIEYKAAWEGIPLSYVSSKNTSRTCPRCGCLQDEHRGEQDPKAWQVFRCSKCGWTCNRHLNAALNLLKTQDEGRWFSPDRFPNEVMTAKRAYGKEDKSESDEDLTGPDSNCRNLISNQPTRARLVLT